MPKRSHKEYHDEDDVKSDTNEEELRTKHSRLEPKKEDQIKESDDDCSICLERLKGNILKTSCNHSFHYKCIRQLFDNDTLNCPNCRRNVDLTYDDDQAVDITKLKLHLPDNFYIDSWLIGGFQYEQGDFVKGAFKSCVDLATILDFENLASLLIINPCKNWPNMTWVTLYTFVYMEKMLDSDFTNIVPGIKQRTEIWLRNHLGNLEENKETVNTVLRFKYGKKIVEDLRVCTTELFGFGECFFC